MVGFIATLLIGLALNIIAYLILPKPKAPKPAEAQDFEDPTAEAGRPVPVVFGEITVTGLNILWFGEKQVHQYNKKGKGKGK